MLKTLEHKGFIYYIRGNVRIQVITDEAVYFYRISQGQSEHEFEVDLENVMANYMHCN